jgi:succinate dehydrogenase/fumarate reductase flavoprotein subunit
MICRAALLRAETRGFLYRTDFPEEGDHWIKNIVFSKAASPSMLNPTFCSAAHDGPTRKVL